MGYLYLLTVALMFSFGGTCNKLASPYFSATFITFFRFFFGIMFLLLLKLIKRQPFQKNFAATVRQVLGWLLFGAAAKFLAYFFENTGFTLSPSYGNIVTQPAQAVFITLSSVFLFREKLSAKKIFCIFLCIGGVLCISWNGQPLSIFFHENFLATMLFIASGCTAGAHVLAQKMVADKMDIIDSNLTIFIFSALMSFCPLVSPISKGALSVSPDLSCILALLGFGFITGIGFYLNAKAIPLVPLYMVPILQSTMVIFALLWGVLFFHEPLTVYTISGTVIFLIGLIWLQLLNSASRQQN